MKKLIPIFLLLSLSARATDHIIGSGSGTVSQNSMTGLAIGDRLLVTAGTYTGGSFKNLSGIQILPVTPHTVFFTGSVSMDHDGGGSFSGFGFPFTSANTAVNIQGGNINNWSFDHLWGTGTGLFFDASGNTVTFAYNDTTKFKDYKVTWDSISLTGCGQLFQGGFGSFANNPLTTTDVQDSVIFSRIKINQTSGNGTQIIGIMFRCYVHDWVDTYTGFNPVTGDVGMLYINGGNFVMERVYMWGGRGYLVRNLGNIRLLNDPMGDARISILRNCIKGGTATYGVMDMRAETVMQHAGIDDWCSWAFYNNTFGNMTDNIGYWCPGVALGSFTSGYTEPGGASLYGACFNNIGFNTSMSNLSPSASHIIIQQGSTAWIADSAGNKYYNSATADNLDSSGTWPTWKPLTSVVPGANGSNTLFISPDYYGNAQTSPPTPGYSVAGGSPPPPPPPPGVDYAPNSKYSIKLP